MSQREVHLTPEGLAKIKAELEHLRTIRRPEVLEKIHQAKDMSSTVNNAEYDDAMNEQAFIEGRIRQLEEMVENASIIHTAPSDWVRLGSRVTVQDTEGRQSCYTIVGSAEASPRDGKISNESPVGRALLGRRVGEEVQVMVPAGVLRLSITQIE